MIPGGRIYLASRSPRRQELLRQIGVTFEVIPIDVDEAALSGESPHLYVERLARAKADAGWQRVEHERLPRAPALGADTTVALEDRILGKPSGPAEAAEMLIALSGCTHEVLTAVAIRFEARLESAVSVSKVRFKRLSEAEISHYVASGDCNDKAGAYGIQGEAARFVAELRGSFSGVVGLPLYETSELLARFQAP